MFTCPTCGTEMKIIAVVIKHEPICLCVSAHRQVHKILSHLKTKKIDPGAGPFAEQTT